ncbi:hypothetical protein D9M73_139080 [compost metagenome]
MGCRAATEFFHQLAGVDADRATLRAQAGGGAGIDALVFVSGFEFGGIDAGAFSRLNVAPDHDALAWAQCQALRRADRFAEAALDAFVDDLVGGRQRLEVLQVQLWIVRQHHPGIEDAGRVEQALELPHQLVGVVPPLQLDEGRHVAPGAVLGLQRAAEFDRHQLRHVVHEGGIAGDLLRRFEALGEDEVQVAFQGMAEEDGLVVAVLVEQRDQAVHTLGQFLHREGDVFDDYRGAGLAHRANSREGVFADGPEAGVFARVFGEVDLLFYRKPCQ